MCYTIRKIFFAHFLQQKRGGIPLKYWRGYITAALFAALTWGLTEFAKAHTALVDMIYPYVTRMIQDFLAGWTADVDFCLWQVLAVLLGLLAISSIVLMIIFRWNFVQWTGWILAVVSLGWCLHTGIYGLNQYASPLADDIRLTVESDITTTDLINATTWFRDQANELALQVPRNSDGVLDAPCFQETAETAADGFKRLVYEDHFSVFAGSTIPVKELGWADMYTAMGIAGVTMPLTGEAAVNPNTHPVSLPWTICHEMAHRMCIAPERDANLAAYLACRANSDVIYQYSAYFMAFRYCYNALASISTSTAFNAANEIYAGITEELLADLQDYKAYYNSVQQEEAVNVANKVNNAYIQASGDESGTKSYGEVTDLLISWYLQEIYLPAHIDDKTEDSFDPLDPDDVFVIEAKEG